MAEGSRTEENRFGYDTSDRVTDVTVEMGAEADLVTTFTFDERRNTISVTDARGNAAGATASDFTTTMTYDMLGRSTTTTSPPVSVEVVGGVPLVEQPVLRIGYDTLGNATHAEDARGFVTVSGYDRLNRVTLITHPSYTRPSDSAVLSPTESYTYDDVGNLLTQTSRRGETTPFLFDTLNRVVRQTDPVLTGEVLGGRIDSEYDDVGNQTLVDDQRGARTTFDFDDMNRLRYQHQIVSQDAATYTSTFDYDDLGNQTSVTNPDGETVQSTYNSASEMLTVIDPLLEQTTYTYEMARVKTTTDPLGRYVTSTYDLAGQLVAVDRHAPNDTLLTTSTFGYDEVGNQITSTSPRGNEGGATPADFTTTMTFDALSRMTDIDQPVSAGQSLATSYGFDAAGNVTRVTNPDAATWSMSYNPWGLQEDYVEPATAAHRSLVDRTFNTSYDGGGLPVHELMSGGVTMTRTFDELSRLVSVSGAGAGAPSKTFDYDLAGFTTGVSHPSGTIGYSYDDRGLLTAATGPAGTATYAYDPVGRLEQRTDVAGTHSFTWTDRGELDTATDGLMGVTTDYAWSVASQVDTVSFGAGEPVRSYSYDDLGRLTLDCLEDSGSSLVTETAYGYDVDGNPTIQDVTLAANPEAGTNAYSYDNAGRILSWTHNGTPTAYSWDGAGNRLTAGADTYTYDDRNQILTGPEGTFTYSARGTTDTVSDGVTTVTYTFDAFGRLTDYNGEASYTHDGLDRVASRNGVGFSYAGTSLDPVSDGGFTYAHSPGGRVLAVDDGTSTFLAGTNRHGDLTHLFTAAGSIVDSSLYDPFGDVIGTSGTVDPTIGFQSDYTDPTSEHVWMGARWYDGGRAAFLSRDMVFGELSTPISLNRYTYGFANPIGFWDPDGRYGECAPPIWSCGTQAQLEGHRSAERKSMESYYEQAERLETDRGQTYKRFGGCHPACAAKPTDPAEERVYLDEAIRQQLEGNRSNAAATASELSEHYVLSFFSLDDPPECPFFSCPGGDPRSAPRGGQEAGSGDGWTGYIELSGCGWKLMKRCAGVYHQAQSDLSDQEAGIVVGPFGTPGVTLDAGVRTAPASDQRPISLTAEGVTPFYFGGYLEIGRRHSGGLWYGFGVAAGTPGISLGPNASIPFWEPTLYKRVTDTTLREK